MNISERAERYWDGVLDREADEAMRQEQLQQEADEAGMSVEAYLDHQKILAEY